MGWDLGFRGELELGESFSIRDWELLALPRGKPHKLWPFVDACRSSGIVGETLARWDCLADPEFVETSLRKRKLVIRGWWTGSRFIDEAGDLFAVLEAAASLEARGVIRLVGYGEDHGFEIVLRARRALVKALTSQEIEALQPELIKGLSPPKRGKRPVRAKASPPKKAPASAPSSPLQQAQLLIGAAPYKALSPTQCRKLGVFRAIGENRGETAIDWLVELLDHPTPDVTHAAADALLYQDSARALEPLISRLGDAGFGGHGISAVSALFKLRPASAYDELEPVRRRVVDNPSRVDLVAKNVLDYLLLSWTDESDTCAYDYDRHSLPRDVLKKDPRWLDWALEIAAVTAQGLELQPLRLLVRAGDPRAWQGFVRAARVHKISVIVQHLEWIGDPAAVPALRMAAHDPSQPHAAELEKLASRLAKRRKPSGYPY